MWRKSMYFARAATLSMLGVFSALVLMAVSAPSARADSLTVADAGGPYWIAEGSNLTLDGRMSQAGDFRRIVSYDWDVGNDGIFDFTGPTGVAFVPWSALQGFARDVDITIRLRVMDDAVPPGSGFDLTTLRIVSPSPVPEPTAAALFGLGVAVLGWRRRRVRSEV